MTLTVRLGERSYGITVERGALSRAGEIFSLARRVLVVTDDGVPAQYARTVAAQCAAPLVVTVPAGEESKSMETCTALLSRMLDAGFTRHDCVAAVGGGVVGDLAGLCASLYMRGVDFYNVPTTVLSQVDSSIGGKTAVNLGGVKNVVGAFYQPRAVLIDPDVLATLPARQAAAGTAEAVKMAMTSDAAFFSLFEEDTVPPPEEIVVRALRIKRSVVEEDEREAGLRQILNFGHTIGHGIEAAAPDHGLLHGECVALGMIPMCSDEARARLVPVLRRLGLPTSCAVDAVAICAAMRHDKKADGDAVTVVEVSEIGACRRRSLPFSALRERVALVTNEN